MGRAGVSWDMIFCGLTVVFLECSWDLPGTFGTFRVKRTDSQPRPGVAAKRTGWAVPGMARRDPEGLGNI